MRISNFILFLISMRVWLASGEKDSSKKTSAITSSNPPDTSSYPKPTEITCKNISPTKHQRPDQRATHESGFHKHRHSQYLCDDSAIPYMAFSDSPRRYIYLSDYTGDYDLRVQNIRQGQPTEYQATLSAISALILNQRNNQEYMPYPSHGDSYNYPDYHGAPSVTEPPALRAYERTIKSNNYIRPPRVIDDRKHTRFLSLDDYRPNEFWDMGPSFYNGADSFNRELLRPKLFV